MQRSHEEKRGGTWVERPELPGRHRPAKVVTHQSQPASRRTVRGIGVKRNDQLALRTAVHIDGDVLRHDALRERYEVLGD